MVKGCTRACTCRDIPPMTCREHTANESLSKHQIWTQSAQPFLTCREMSRNMHRNIMNIFQKEVTLITSEREARASFRRIWEFPAVWATRPTRPSRFLMAYNFWIMLPITKWVTPFERRIQKSLHIKMATLSVYWRARDGCGKRPMFARMTKWES